MPNGIVFNIQRYCVHDGPGIRTTVFLKGCPLSCVWCHNPEAEAFEPQVLLQENRCIRCGSCRAVCAHTAELGGQIAAVAAPQLCGLCGACVEVCPTEALEMVGQSRSVGDVLEEILRDRMFYDESGGGVTLSGGEPLAQGEFALELLRESRAAGIHTAVDTCGHGDEATLLGLADFTDLFLYDLKFIDEARHLQFTGVSNQRILSNLEALGRAHANIWIRVPIVPGLNDDAAELEALAEFASGIPGVREVNLLPYHKIGVQKRRRLGQRSPLDELPEPSPERVNEALATFQSKGLKIRMGG